MILFNKTTKLMNHLGGMVIAWSFLVEWLHKARGLVNLVYLTCGWPPRTKRFEMSNVEKLQVQPLGNMGSAMII